MASLPMLVLNSGSSSIKFSVYETGGGDARLIAPENFRRNLRDPLCGHAVGPGRHNAACTHVATDSYAFVATISDRAPF
jgi:acetate kinase